MAVDAGDAQQLYPSLSIRILHTSNSTRQRKLLQRLSTIKHALKPPSGKCDHPDYIPNGFSLTSSSKRQRRKQNTTQEKCFLYEAIQTFHYLSFSGKTNNSKPQKDTLRGPCPPRCYWEQRNTKLNKDVYWQTNKQMGPFWCNLDEWSIQVFSVMAISTTTQSISDSV